MKILPAAYRQPAAAVISGAELTAPGCAHAGDIHGIRNSAGAGQI